MSTVRPIVFMDINIGETPAGRIKMELFSDIVPKVPNFMCQGGDFLKGDGTGTFSIYGDKFPVRHTSYIQVDQKLTRSMQDENFQEKHTGPGLLSMVRSFLMQLPHSAHHILTHRLTRQANSGPNTNGCQFFITTAKCDFLDGKHVVFGRVIDGMLALRKIENVPTGPNNRPKLVVKITECGEM
ncbi:hypothetical protein H0H81_002031 [Sphagnurus paluster]|uniref:Peptidyl-prolyl cis-trans isomerase n=1 Tax=Sphagnurus paluster TaxID=117069 RepID=A0A9P7FTW7_9AGAR|nr:hypothetical protein H0H81_002031 [Sphagnurus paluster]